MSLDEQVRNEMAALYASDRCDDCGGMHKRACPRVKRIAYNINGTVRVEVEYWPPGWEENAEVLWPEDLF